MYALLCTRLDITFVMSVTSRYQSNLDEEHWIAVKNILKYLRRTKNLFLIFGGEDLQVQGYIDADFRSDIDDRKSILDFIFLYNGGAVSWKSSKQLIIVDFTMEIEYITTSEADKEGF